MNILKSFSRLIAFSTLILTLAIALDSSDSCALNLLPDKNEGIVKKLLLRANRSLAVYPLSAKMR